MTETRPCPKCQKTMVSNGIVHAIPAYTGPVKPVSENQLSVVILFVCPECRYTELYSPKV